MKAKTATGGVLLGMLSGIALGLGPVHAAQVDITNGNGTITDQFMSSEGGLSSDQFAGSRSNGVSVWLRARNQGDQGPVERDGDTFRIREATGADGDRFSLEFQFSPRDGDTRENSNYFLRLDLDNDPSQAVNFGANTNTFFARVFDDDGDDELVDSGRSTGTPGGRSWDDGDSVAIDGTSERGGEEVDFNNPTGDRGNLPSYVVANSWLAEWDFSNFSLLGDDFGGAPGPGFYDLSLSAFEDAQGEPGEELASVQITAQVGQPVPAPAPWLLLAAGLAFLGLFRRSGQ